MPKVTKLSQLKSIDGKVHPEDSNKPFEPSTMDQLFNSNAGLTRYGTMDEEEYKEELDEMNLADLREHAVKVAGIIPRDVATERLKKNLVAEFKRYVGLYKKPNPIKKDLNKNLEKQARDILSAAK